MQVFPGLSFAQARPLVFATFTGSWEVAHKDVLVPAFRAATNNAAIVLDPMLSMDQIAKKTNDEALKVFKKAIENVKPVLEVKTRRVGGANYQVPVEVNPFRRQSLAIRWLILYARSRAGKTMIDKLADELIDAANSRGGAMKKKEDVHRMAEANKAFAHYRW